MAVSIILLLCAAACFLIRRHLLQLAKRPKPAPIEVPEFWKAAWQKRHED